jgi:acetylornithine deacetylase
MLLLSGLIPWHLLSMLSGAAVARQEPLFDSRSSESQSRPSADLLSLHRSLIEIESISGNEQKLGNWLASYLEERGFVVEKQHVSNTSFNVFAYAPGNRESKLLVTSHMDTVCACC